MSRRTKTEENNKADISLAAHSHNVSVLVSNIILFNFFAVLVVRVNDCRPLHIFLKGKGKRKGAYSSS